LNSKAILLAAAVAIFLAGCGRQQQAQQGAQAQAAGKAEVGSAAPGFTLKTLAGEDFTLSSARDKNAVVLVFFASWCTGCMAEVPQLIEFHKAYADKGVPVYGINVQEKAAVVQNLVKAKGITYTVLLDESGAVGRAYGVYGIPLVIGVGKDGTVKYRDHSLPDDKDLFVKQLQ
jgi:peroxiredoxin